MITEPELTGDSTGDGAARPQAADLVDDLAPRGAPAWRRPPWLWGALAGAVAASAVWAVPLAHGGSAQDRRPDLHGYAIGFSPCAGDPFGALATAVRARSTSTAPATFAHGPALDQAQCAFTAIGAPDQGWTTSYTVRVSVDLHKLTDPRAEFEDESALDTTSLAVAQSTAEVSGLGDKAYSLAFGDQTQLKVLSGGAVITLRLSAASRWAGAGGGPKHGDLVSDTPQQPDTSDLGGYTPQLARAARAVMAALSRG